VETEIDSGMQREINEEMPWFISTA
jgi:hypothetical protein